MSLSLEAQKYLEAFRQRDKSYQWGVRDAVDKKRYFGQSLIEVPDLLEENYTFGYASRRHFHKSTNSRRATP